MATCLYDNDGFTFSTRLYAVMKGVQIFVMGEAIVFPKQCLDPDDRLMIIIVFFFLFLFLCLIHLHRTCLRRLSGTFPIMLCSGAPAVVISSTAPC